MNKIALILPREKKMFSLPFIYVTQKKNLCSFSPNVASFILCTKEIQGSQTLLNFERHMSFISMNNIKYKLRSFISDNTKAKVGGALAFEKIGDNINYTEFFQCFELPDTFQSWFLALQLHVWMTISAAIPDKKGKVFRISMVDSMWNDVELRMEKLATMKSSRRKKYLTELVMEFQAGLISYDEGILSDDTVLAAAAWRMLFACKPVHPQLLENAVLYIRKQLAHVESQNIPDIVYRGSVTFLPLNSIFSDDEM